MFSNSTKSERRLVPNGIAERWTSVRGHRMRYLQGGTGPALLLVHGLMGFSFSWSENLAALAKHFTVYAPDLLNAGYSDRCEIDVDLQSSADLLLEFMNAVQIERADVLGTSYGGAITMALAATAPERVKRLILVAPAHCGSESHRWQSKFFSTRFGAMVAPLLYLAPAFIHGYFIKRMYAVPSRALGGTVKEYAAADRISGTIAPLVKLMRCWDRNFQELAAMMPKIANIPTLLVWGDKDSVVPVDTMHELALCLRQSSIAQIEDAGHLPYEELPEEFNRTVLGFLLSVPPAAANDQHFRTNTWRTKS